MIEGRGDDAPALPRAAVRRAGGRWPRGVPPAGQGEARDHRGRAERPGGAGEGDARRGVQGGRGARRRQVPAALGARRGGLRARPRRLLHRPRRGDRRAEARLHSLQPARRSAEAVLVAAAHRARRLGPRRLAARSAPLSARARQRERPVLEPPPHRSPPARGRRPLRDRRAPRVDGLPRRRAVRREVRPQAGAPNRPRRLEGPGHRRDGRPHPADALGHRGEGGRTPPTSTRWR